MPDDGGSRRRVEQHLRAGRGGLNEDGPVRSAPAIAPGEPAEGAEVFPHDLGYPETGPDHGADGEVADDFGTLTTGLLSTACGLQRREIASLEEISIATVGRRLRQHRCRMRTDPSYARLAGLVLAASVTPETSVIVQAPGANRLT